MGDFTSLTSDSTPLQIFWLLGATLRIGVVFSMESPLLGKVKKGIRGCLILENPEGMSDVSKIQGW